MGVRKLPPTHWAIRAEKLFRQSVKEDIEAHKKAGRYVRIARAATTGRFTSDSIPTKNLKGPKQVGKPDKRT
jgi:hypothetical protein